MSSNSHLIIHASNISGLGASKVVSSLIDSFVKMYSSENISLILPENGLLKFFKEGQSGVIRYHRFLPNAISRFIECFFSPMLFDRNACYIVLGDIPLHGIDKQIVLVHQSNLIYPRINPNSGRSLTFRINRYLFKRNLRFAKAIIVQTDVMKSELLASYPMIGDRIKVVPQPLPSNIDKKNSNISIKKSRDKTTLFYPSAGYPHKNHDFLVQISEEISPADINFIIYVTLLDEEFTKYRSLPFVKNLGRLSDHEMSNAYASYDALLFLSKAESYGLPLIEAMTFQLPILSIDLPYARWMCEEEAIYFQPDDSESFLHGLNRLKQNINFFDYKRPLEKFPVHWDDVAKDFYESLDKIRQ